MSVVITQSSPNCFYSLGHFYVNIALSGMRALPSCIVIGSRKGGTRALLDMLSLHSRVRPAKAEVHFFDADDNYRRGYEWYMEQVLSHIPSIYTI